MSPPFYHIIDLARASTLLDQYGDLGLDFTGSCIVALAERLNVRPLLTFDGRHFTAVPPRHCPAFELLPLWVQASDPAAASHYGGPAPAPLTRSQRTQWRTPQLGVFRHKPEATRSFGSTCMNASARPWTRPPFSWRREACSGKAPQTACFCGG